MFCWIFLKKDFDFLPLEFSAAGFFVKRDARDLPPGQAPRAPPRDPLPGVEFCALPPMDPGPAEVAYRTGLPDELFF